MLSELKPDTRPSANELEQWASDLSMAVWNRIAQLPQFGHLLPKDFPLVYESVHAELKRLYAKRPEKRGQAPAPADPRPYKVSNS